MIHIFPKVNTPFDEDVRYPAVSLSEFFDRVWPYDAMAVPYRVPGAEAIPRLLVKEGHADLLRAKGCEPLLTYAILDLDNHGHEAWEKKLQAAAFLDGLLEDLPSTLQDTAGGYTTRAGVRLMWTLDPPVPVSLAKSLLVQLCALVEARTGVPVDPCSHEWSRFMRAPRARRDGVNLDPYVDAAPLLDGEVLKWQTLGFAPLTEGGTEAYDLGEIPDAPVQVTSLDWARADAPQWLQRGDAFPPEAGHTYPALRSTLARLAATGDITDPQLLYSMVLASTVATPSRSPEEAWKLAAWVAQRQGYSLARRTEEEAERPEEVALPTLSEWADVAPHVKVESIGDRRLLERLVAGTRPHRNREDTLAALSRGAELLARPLNHVAQVYRFLLPSAKDARKTTPEQLWTLCTSAVQLHRDKLKAYAETAAFVQRHPLLVSVRTGVYILNTQTQPYTYEHVHKDDLLPGMARQFLYPNLPKDLEVDFTQPLRNAFAEYGLTAKNLVYVSGQRGALLVKAGETWELHVGVHTLRVAVPEYDEGVDRWLRALGGADVEKFLDWLAALTYTRENPCAALYLHGPKGIGKSLLISGIASLWDDRPCDYNAIANGSWTSDLLTSPLVAADEGLKVGKFDRYRVAAEFRNYTANARHTVKQRFVGESTLLGCLRLIFCSNEGDSLPFEGSLDQEGIDAIAERILYVRAGGSAAQVLADIGGRTGVAHWVRHGEVGALGRHLLWLRATRVLKPDARFLVSGSGTDWHRRLAANQGRKPEVLELVLDMLAKATRDPTVHVLLDPENDCVLVNLDSVRAELKQPTAPRMTFKVAREELTKLSVGTERPRFAQGQRRALAIPVQAFIDTGLAERADFQPQGEGT